MPKRCADCEQVKPRTEFNARTAAVDGLQSYCRSCSARRKKRWAQANSEKVAADYRRWRAENPEIAREASRSWRERNAARHAASKAEWDRRNRDRRREMARADRKANPAKHRRSLAAWKAANRERVREYQRRRRAAGYGAPVDAVDLALLLEMSGGRCGICADPLVPDARWPDPLSTSVDHVVPLSRGGAHALANLRLAHLVCNLRKGNRAA